MSNINNHSNNNSMESLPSLSSTTLNKEEWELTYEEKRDMIRVLFEENSRYENVTPEFIDGLIGEHETNNNNKNQSNGTIINHINRLGKDSSLVKFLNNSFTTFNNIEEYLTEEEILKMLNNLRNKIRSKQQNGSTSISNGNVATTSGSSINGISNEKVDKHKLGLPTNSNQSSSSNSNQNSLNGNGFAAGVPANILEQKLLQLHLSQEKENREKINTIKKEKIELNDNNGCEKEKKSIKKKNNNTSSNGTGGIANGSGSGNNHDDQQVPTLPLTLNTNIPLHIILGGINVMDTRNGMTVPFTSLWENQRCIIMVFRRFGCLVCRLQALDLSTLKPFFDKMGVRMVGIGFESLGLEEFKEGKFFAGDIYLDKSRAVYRSLSLKRMGYWDSAIQLTDSRLTVYRKTAKELGMPHNFRGDGLQLGGTLVVGPQPQGAHYDFRQQRFTDIFDIQKLVDSCKVPLPEPKTIEDQMKELTLKNNIPNPITIPLSNSSLKFDLSQNNNNNNNNINVNNVNTNRNNNRYSTSLSDTVPPISSGSNSTSNISQITTTTNLNNNSNSNNNNNTSPKALKSQTTSNVSTGKIKNNPHASTYFPY